MKEYYLDFTTREGFHTLPVKAVKQFRLPEPSKHPACWDAVIDSAGRIIFSECSELTTGVVAKLSTFDPASETYQNLFSLKDYVFPGERTIRDSKIHTSMSWMEDGRLIFITHTTDKSPVHPAWLPTSYYNHIWEGYPGSSLMIYDPATGKLENCGIPAPRETLYGGAYDKIGHIYYAIGTFRGHLFGIDMRNRSVKDYGQVTEHHTYRLVVGPDDNIYFTTRNGLLQRINVREKKVENLHIQLPYKEEAGRLRSYLTYAVTGPDGKLYLSGMHDDRLDCYDVHTGEFTVVGSYLNTKQFLKGEPSNSYIGSMAFDRNGVLYYAVCGMFGKTHKGTHVPAILHRWDFLHGGQPEDLGIPGTAQHAIVTTCTMMINDKTHRLYMVGGNHAFSAPDIVEVDLDVLAREPDGAREAVTDTYTVIGNEENLDFAEMMADTRSIMSKNSPRFSFGPMIPVRLWEEFDDDAIVDSAVTKITLAGEKIVVTCGKAHHWQFILSADGTILEKTALEGTVKNIAEAGEPDPKLPIYPGRTYKAGMQHTVKLSGNRKLCATEDGMLAIQTGNHYFALGPAWVNGPVNDMAATTDGKKVYGVAGDKDDLGIVFSYDDEDGLRYLGQVEDFSLKYGAVKSSYLTAIAVNDDASMLVIGSGERLGTVFIYRRQ